MSGFSVHERNFTSSNPELAVQDYKNTVKTRGENLIRKSFPETILKLNAFLENSQFKDRKFSDFHQDLNVPVPDPIILGSSTELPRTKKTKYDESFSHDGTKVMVLPCGSVPTNKSLVELVEIVKPYIRKLIEDCNLIKMWLSFMIPKIEDGNNFGVSVQEEILGEIMNVEVEGGQFLDQIARYFVARAKLITKVAKYPHVDDYRQAVQEIDEKEYLSLWLTLSEVRNRYCTLHDIIQKNIDKINKPRTNNIAETLY